MSDKNRDAIKQILKWYGCWTLLQIALLVLGEGFPWWIRFLPAIIMMAGLILSGIAILISHRKFSERSIIIKGKVIHACLYCPYRQTKDNPLSVNRPIVHCGADPGLPLVLDPRHIPWWCTHAT